MSLECGGHGGDIFKFSHEKQNAIRDFSTNINPLGMSPLGWQALKKEEENIILRYPDILCRDMKKSLSIRLGISEQCITCGNGATELMYALMRILKPSRVYVGAPSFSEYKLAAESIHADVISFPLEQDQEFAVPISFFKKKMTAHSVIFIGNPNNPDGHILKEDEFSELLDLAERNDSFLVIDESFIDFLPDSFSYRYQLNQSDRLVILSSLTKFYAIPGLRAGYMISSKQLADAMAGELVPWNVNGLAQLYVSKAVLDTDYIARSRDYIKKENQRFSALLQSFSDVEKVWGSVNFLLLHLKKDALSGSGLQQNLLPLGFLIRKCGNFETLDDHWVRLAVRSEEEDNALIRCLRKAGMK
jgi:threonine-phosphate decarboxylase